MTDDVVAQLDAWLTAWEGPDDYRLTVQRARDEIEALRRIVNGLVASGARAAALEEAAQRCDRLATDYTIPVSADKWSAGCRGCAGRIRALKEKRDAD